jgi:hypothetical protein
VGNGGTVIFCDLMVKCFWEEEDVADDADDAAAAALVVLPLWLALADRVDLE